MDTYTTALIACMDHWASNAIFDTVYLGGGTPSLLGGKRLVSILQAVHQKFRLTANTEITVECNPDSMDTALLTALHKVGVNRLSIGVQSAHDVELRTLGRRHTFAEAEQAVKRAQDCGFYNLSLDLMYGLPDQTQTAWMQSVEAILALQPQHISCYGLKIEPNTAIAQRKLNLPDGDAQADMYLALCDRLASAGFAQYEISNWAKDGKLSRHNAKYWDLTPYLGLGCGAHSLWQGERFAYPRDLSTFCQGATVQPEEQMDDFSLGQEYLMLCLRTSKGVNTADFTARFGAVGQAIAQQMEKLCKHGLTAPTAGGWRLTPQGFLVSNAILCDLFDLWA